MRRQYNTNGVAWWKCAMCAISRFFRRFSITCFNLNYFQNGTDIRNHDVPIYLVACLKFKISEIFGDQSAKSPRDTIKRESQHRVSPNCIRRYFSKNGPRYLLIFVKKLLDCTNNPLFELRTWLGQKRYLTPLFQDFLRARLTISSNSTIIFTFSSHHSWSPRQFFGLLHKPTYCDCACNRARVRFGQKLTFSSLKNDFAKKVFLRSTILHSVWLLDLCSCSSWIILRMNTRFRQVRSFVNFL